MIGLLALALPPIVHAVYRFIDNIDVNRNVNLLKDLSTLYLSMGVLSWQIFAGYFECKNAEFCEMPYENGVNTFVKSVDEVCFFL